MKCLQLAGPFREEDPYSFLVKWGKFVFQLKMLLHTSAGGGGGIIYMSVEEDHTCCMNTVKMAKYPYPCLTCAT